jgi:hypothetical protein
MLMQVQAVISIRARPSFISIGEITGAATMKPSAYAINSRDTTEYVTSYWASIEGRTAPVYQRLLSWQWDAGGLETHDSVHHAYHNEDCSG